MKDLLIQTAKNTGLIDAEQLVKFLEEDANKGRIDEAHGADQVDIVNSKGRIVEKYKVNGFYVVPTMWNILLRTPEADSVDTSSLRIGLSGTAPIPPAQLAVGSPAFYVIFLIVGALVFLAAPLVINKLKNPGWKPKE